MFYPLSPFLNSKLFGSLMMVMRMTRMMTMIMMVTLMMAMM